MRLSCGIVAGALQLRTEAAAPDELLRNRWTIWAGISGRIASESVDCLLRNQWTSSIGMGGRIAPEWVDDLGRNMQEDQECPFQAFREGVQ